MSKLTEDLLDMVATADYVEVPKGLIQKIVQQLEGFEWKQFKNFKPAINGDYEIICENGEIHRCEYRFSPDHNDMMWIKTTGVGMIVAASHEFASPPVLIRSFTPFIVQK